MMATPDHAADPFAPDQDDDLQTGRSDAEHGDQFPGDDADDEGGF